MMNSGSPEDASDSEELSEDITVVYYTSQFKRDVRQLAKKYRRIRLDIQPVIEQLLEGQTPGVQVPRVRYPVFKVRVKNTDARRGKSGGYRLIYYVRTSKMVVLITLYSKSEQGDLVPEAIRQLIESYETEEEDR